MDVMRSVKVSPALNGFIVEVGCQILVFNRIEDVAENLVAYQKNPEAIEKKFQAECVNKTLENGPMATIAPGQLVRGVPAPNHDYTGGAISGVGGQAGSAG